VFYKLESFAKHDYHKPLGLFPQNKKYLQNYKLIQLKLIGHRPIRLLRGGAEKSFEKLLATILLGQSPLRLLRPDGGFQQYCWGIINVSLT
jgi:hypothetical protein